MTFHTLKHTAVLAGITASVLATLVVSAQSPNLRITEIMYDAQGADGGKEYIEVFNTGPEDVVMTVVRLSEHERNHTIKPWRGSSTLKPGESAIIADRPERFLEEYSFDGTVFDSAFTLNNTGSTLSLLYQGQELHSITYTRQDGANGDGRSLHVSKNDTLKAQSPSLGSVSGIAVTTPKTDAPETEESPEERAEKEPIRLTINPRVVFSASTTSFSLIDKTEKNKYGELGKVLYGVWNFGDGTSFFGDTVEHAYLHPGTYIISFQEHQRGKPTDRPVLQKEIRVLFPQITLERIDSAFVRFNNHHPFVLDISGWKLIAGQTVFTFPEKSFVPAQEAITVPLQSKATDNRVLFVTAGGGQFDGTHAASEQTGEEKDTEPAPPDETLPVVPKTIPDTQPNTTQHILVWITLLLTIIAITLTPLFFIRTKKEKKTRKKSSKKKK